MKTFLCTKNILQNFHIFAQNGGVFAFFVQIQYLKVFSKDMKHSYADNIQFGGDLHFGIKHTMSTLNIGQMYSVSPTGGSNGAIKRWHWNIPRRGM